MITNKAASHKAITKSSYESSYGDPEIDRLFPSFVSLASDVLATIEDLPIDRLGERQGMLVKLLADVVAYETESGSLVTTERVQAQPFWTSLKILTDSLNFKVLGTGHFAAVYSHPLLPNKAIKVGFKKEDSGAAYAAWCRDNQGRVGVPTIHEINRHTACYTVVMDKLSKFIGGEGRGYDETFKHFEIACRALYNYAGGGYAWDEKSSALINTMRDIRSYFIGIAYFDLHEDNVMVDKNDDLVITDPVSWSRREED